MGHILVLYHTWNFTSCSSDDNDCLNENDFVCDTPIDPRITYTDVDPNTCEWFGSSDVVCNPNNFTPSTNNIMSYSAPACLTNLTQGQGNQIRRWIYDWGFGERYLFNTMLECPVEPDTSTHFITTWQVDNTSTDITIPTFPGETYSYDVDWEGDGIFDDFGVTGDITHDYGTAGTYEVQIRGNFPRIYFNGQIGLLRYININQKKIIEVNQWGSQVWTSMESAFRACNNLNILASDSPNLSNVSDMSHMFSGTPNIGSINDWNVSNVNNMSYLFSHSAYNNPLNNWDVSNVTNMEGMFLNAQNFNQVISNWNVSNVTNMRLMFTQAFNYNKPLSGWGNNLGNVSNMSFMFMWASNFNQPINNWNVSNVIYMDNMFHNTSNFNQSLNDWDFSNVQYMGEMFQNATNFDQTLGDWDVSNVINFSGILNFTNLSTSNYDDILINWAQLNLQPNIGMSVGDANFCSGLNARQNIINNFGWTIYDGGIDPTCRVAVIEKNNINIFPNPTNSVIKLEFTEKSISNFKIEVNNIYGITEIKSQNQLQLDLSNLNTGVYFIKITTHTGDVFVKQILKK